MSRSSPLSTAYQNLLSKGRLRPNTGQAALVDQLGRIQHGLTVGSRWWKHDAASSNGIYIYGGVGTGKSRIADLFAATLPANVTRRRAHFFEFMMDTHMRLHRARSQANYAGDPLTRIGQEIHGESSVLCLDEFQVSDIADAMILKRLFGSFWESGGIMVSTSNRHPTKLYKNGLNRPLFIPFIQELERRCLVFKMEGDHDYRMDGQKQHKRQDIFFVDALEFQNSLSNATNGTTPSPVEIPVVMNRKLKVDAAQPQPPSTDTQPSSPKPIVSTTFSTLCKAPLSASDYHALCAYTSTIYLSGLRRFASDELDIVRRFITLVDVAYESRTRVFCLSTDPILKTFENIILAESPRSNGGNGGQSPSSEALDKLREVLQDQNLTVKGEGGSSSSMMSTFINDVEWSATGLKEASLATGGAGETDVRFAVGRAISRLSEMGSVGYGVAD
ncbi:hypothetical protein OHC33_000021 [Knufia fluminis]|uniref:AFG1-like ATPase n=1 Tax=Knufia fluminis TaxID=191047 RepID=A0AAN8EPI1_9EURO|nr:hypothetical protein OHC33_000021 [Knufia fluminis]